mmetsp:Transcript_10248/g.20747  ORF Transcript_10248/g.20747 Transcript_10248/m.20747 type:complete len:216 (-) Transcript_10248:664-1311(-)
MLCTWMHRGTILHELGKLIDIKCRHSNRHGQVHSHRPGDTHLLNSEIRIGRNDCTSRKIDTFSHQVTSNTTFLGFETLRDGFERPSGPLCDLRHTTQFVVHKGGNVVLQGQLELFHDNGWFTIGNGLLQTHVGLDNVDQLMGEIIFRGGSTGHHRRSHMERWHRQHLYQHPVGSTVRLVQSENFNVLFTNHAKNFHHRLATQKLLGIPGRPPGGF